MTENVDAAVTRAIAVPRRLGSMSWSWVGVTPFFLFALLSNWLGVIPLVGQIELLRQLSCRRSSVRPADEAYCT